MTTLTNGNPDKLILIKESDLIKEHLDYYYKDNYVAIGIPVDAKGKDRKELMDEIQELYPPFKVVICANTDMFKTITKIHHKGKDGIACDSPLGKTFIVPNWRAIIYDSNQETRLKFIMERVDEFLNTGMSSILGSNVLQNIKYYLEGDDYSSGFTELYNHDALTVDIETTSLHHYNGVILSIAFSWNTHDGIAMQVSDNPKIKELLKEFFLNYKGKKIFHNASFDTMFLIYHCFMKNLEDWNGMLEGLHCIFNNLEDTKIIAYLALNTCTTTSLSLKDLSHEYTGDYAQSDIDDCSKIPMERLLPYNVTDTCATWYVYDKYKPRMIQDQQEEIYNTLLLPSLKTLVETQLVGFRLNPKKVEDLAANLYTDQYMLQDKLKKNKLISTFEEQLKKELVFEYNNEHKKKKKTVEDFNYWCFNFNSDLQVRKFLYNYLQLPVIDLTKSKQPSTSTETLEKLLHHTQDNDIKEALNAFFELSKVTKIITAFLDNFTNAPEINNLKGLYGNFNLCGTKSGRLSSSNPNLQQLPSTGSPYAKPVKKIFTAPKGYVFCGADQRSLEDHISALITKDPQKLLVYTDNYDGHCLRSFSYYKEQMPDIEEKMKYADRDCKYFKVTHDNGTVEYFCEEDPMFKSLT